MTPTAVGGSPHVVTPARFAQGMSFEAYLTWIATPENLSREAGWWLGPTRQDFSEMLRTYHATLRLTDDQTAAIRWLATRPRGPRNIVVISEEWSSDCRRDVPMIARLAEAGGLTLRIFTRDGDTVGRGPQADRQASPNADLVNAFLLERDGRTYQAIPVAAFYTDDLEYLYHYTERPAICRRDRITDAMRRPRPGETEAEAWPRFLREWADFQQSSPFFRVWGRAAVDEMLCALHERVVSSRGLA